MPSSHGDPLGRDNAPPDPDTYVVLPLMEPPKGKPDLWTMSDLLRVMAALRTQDTGCPWDLAQSFRTIAPFTIEEAYEVADAIERGDLADLEEELGDLLLQVVYHARLAEEAEAFGFAEVVDGIVRKMIRRHPHVFGDATARSAGMAKDIWEKIKAEEKAAKVAARRQTSSKVSIADTSALDIPPALPSLLEDVPAGLPALTRAIKLQNKAAKVGFDWPSVAPVFAKIKEELAELEDALAEERVSFAHSTTAKAKVTDDHKMARPLGSSPTLPTMPPHASNCRAVEDEFGDLLFVMANLARHLAIDPEAALRAANQKFIRRFRSIEAALAREGRSPAQSNLAEMDALWDAAKGEEKDR